MLEIWKEKLGKFGVCDCIGPGDLPESIEGYPTPWKVDSGGNGHYYVSDDCNNPLFHIFCWDEKEYSEFNDRMRRFNKDSDECKIYA